MQKTRVNNYLGLVEVENSMKIRLLLSWNSKQTVKVWIFLYLLNKILLGLEVAGGCGKLLCLFFPFSQITPKS